MRPSPRPTPSPYTTLFRSAHPAHARADALRRPRGLDPRRAASRAHPDHDREAARRGSRRSEEHTSELQSHHDLVCRLLLEKKNFPQKPNEKGSELNIEKCL